MRGIILSVLLVLAACASDDPTSDELADGDAAPTAADGPVVVAVDVIQTGLIGPTQIAADGRGGFVVAELNGAEGDGTGRVLHLVEAGAEPVVLLDGLDVPTGVAVDGDLVWIMERRSLSVAPLDRPDERRVVLDDLPYNGRSEGTISPVPGGGILFDTSGRRLGGGRLVDGSGTLWYLAGPDDEPEPFATGFKHAYAHAPLPDGRWLVTEISDGRLDGEVPPDELVVAANGDDFAYPRCVGDRTPVGETGGTETECAATPPSLTLFDPAATPTGVALAPWDPSLAVVALWVPGEIVTVSLDDGEVTELQVGGDIELGRPQHLLADGDRLLVTDHDGGRLLSITAG